MTLNVMGNEGAEDLTFSIRNTAISSDDVSIDLILGETDDGMNVQVFIPTTATPTLALREPEA